jgi:hypothetical protein
VSGRSEEVIGVRSSLCNELMYYLPSSILFRPPQSVLVFGPVFPGSDIFGDYEVQELLVVDPDGSSINHTYCADRC